MSALRRPVFSKSGIYVASRTHHAPRWRQLRAQNYQVMSSWIDLAAEGVDAPAAETWPQSIAEVATSSALLVYIEKGDSPLRGALVEVGAALACGVPVHVCCHEELDSATRRPLGSWIKHPLVREHASVELALRAATRDWLQKACPISDHPMWRLFHGEENLDPNLL